MEDSPQLEGAQDLTDLDTRLWQLATQSTFEDRSLRTLLGLERLRKGAWFVLGLILGAAALDLMSVEGAWEMLFGVFDSSPGSR